jgi:hypothetical protein
MKKLGTWVLLGLLVWAVVTVLKAMVIVNPADAVAKAIVFATDVNVAKELFLSGASMLTVDEFNYIMDIKAMNDVTSLSDIYAFLTTSQFDLLIAKPLAKLTADILLWIVA